MLFSARVSRNNIPLQYKRVCVTRWPLPGQVLCTCMEAWIHESHLGLPCILLRLLQWCKMVLGLDNFSQLLLNYDWNPLFKAGDPKSV